MKKFLLGTVALAALGVAAPAIAADLPAKSPVYAKAPVMASVFSWTGCYVGAHAGYGWGRKSVTDNPASDWLLGAPFAVDTSGFLGGGQVGCNYQASRNFVVGVEGDFSFADIKGSAAVPTNLLVSLIARARTDWLATATARAGYSFDRSLIYVKGGGAWAHDIYGGDWNFGGGFLGTVGATEIRSGWVVGAGFEYAVTNNWTAKIEYNYMDFGTKAVSFPVAAPGFGTYVGNINQKIQTVKIGVNYLFGGPVVAKY